MSYRTAISVLLEVQQDLISDSPRPRGMKPYCHRRLVRVFTDRHCAVEEAVLLFYDGRHREQDAPYASVIGAGAGSDLIALFVEALEVSGSHAVALALNSLSTRRS